MIFVLLVLTTWRVSHWLSYERGFYGISIHLRDNIDNVWPDRLRTIPGGKHIARFIRECGLVLNCSWCVSKPVGALLSIALYADGQINLTQAVLLPFALSATTAMIDRIMTWLEQASEHI